MTDNLQKLIHCGVDILNAGEQISEHPLNIFTDIGDVVSVLFELKNLDLNPTALLAEVENLGDDDLKVIADELDSMTVLPSHASVGLFVKQVLVLLAKLDELTFEVIALVKGAK